jgi:hypothetical protein
MTFSSIRDFFVVFQQHPLDPKAHTHLNNVFSGDLPDPSRLYTDAVTQDVVKDDADLLAEIRRILTYEMIAPHATLTFDSTMDIEPKINLAALFIVNGNSQRRLNKASLTRVLEAAVIAGKDHVEIKISMAHIYFDASGGPLNYLDWSLLPTTTTAIATPPAPATAVDIARAVAASIPAPATAAELATAFATVYPTRPVGAGGPTPTTATSSGTSIVSSMYLFNYKSLPADVATRYLNKKVADGIITGSTVSTRYAAGNFYHEEGTDTIILADGSYFMVQTPNEKEFVKASISCEDDTHAGVRSWYENFVKACHDYGFYAHPLWCFRKDHGGDQGFSIRNDADDDLLMMISPNAFRSRSRVWHSRYTACWSRKTCFQGTATFRL